MSTLRSKVYGDVSIIASKVPSAYGDGSLTVDGTLEASNLTYPTSAGISGQVLTTDGVGTLTFQDSTAELKLYDENFVMGSTEPIASGDNSIAMGVGAVVGTDYSVVGGGQTNKITSGNYGVIGGGKTNNIETSAGKYNSILGGALNKIKSGNYGIIGGGRQNSIYSSAGGQNCIVGGRNNEITNGNRQFIGGGLSNRILATNNDNVICGGSTNRIYGTSLRGFIGGGFNNHISTGQDNVISGGYINYITGGKFNSILGGYQNTISSAGNYNFIFGYKNDITSGTNTVVFGTEISTGESDGFFSSQIKKTIMAGAPVYVDATSGQLGNFVSTIRVKKDIEPLSSEKIEQITKLKPIKFKFKTQSVPEQDYYGFIAEEVNEVYPELITKDKDGEIQVYNFNSVWTIAVANIQKLIREKQTTDQRIRILEEQFNTFKETTEEHIKLLEEKIENLSYK